MTAPRIDLVAAGPFTLAESPSWDERTGRLLWCDIPARTIHALEVGSGRRDQWVFDSEVGSFGLTDRGRLVVALRSEIVIFDPADGHRRRLVEIEADNPKTRSNDGKVGPDGAFWVGTMDEHPEKRPDAALYRVTGGGVIERKVTGLKVANGLAWSPDGDWLYHSDSRGPWIDRWRFDPRSGAISDRQRFVTPDDTIGRPDGGATDSEGCYWSCGVSAGRLNRFSPDGELLEFVEMPVPNPTMPCFGGPDLRTLFVTTHRENYSAEQRMRHPHAGAVFAFRVDVPGAPIGRFVEG